VKKKNSIKVVVTSGPTRAYIDSIRYISNYSTGRLGSLTADKLAREGFKVSFIYGKGSLLPKSRGIKAVEVETVAEFLKALKKELRSGAKAVVHAMAVLDYEPEKNIKGKVKSDKKFWILKLKRTSKVINEVKKISPGVLLVGFKLEYGKGEAELRKAAEELFKKSGADFVVANDYGHIKKGNHKALVLGTDGSRLSASGKENIADAILDRIKERLC